MLFGRFHKDTDFTAKYRTRWNEKYKEGVMQSMLAFFNETADKIRVSHSLDNRRWYEDRYDFNYEISKLKEYWSNRIMFLNSAINNQ